MRVVTEGDDMERLSYGCVMECLFLKNNFNKYYEN